MTQDRNIFIHNIYYMLTYAFQELKQNNYEEIAGEDFDTILQLFAQILTKGIACQLKQGIYRTYITKLDSIPTLRGKLYIAQTIRNKLGRRQQIACEFDELSEDNIYNQIIKTTVLILIKEESVKKEQKKKLKNMMLFFSNVSTINLVNIKWNMLKFDRNNKSYQMLLYICYFISESILMTTESGKYKMKTFTDEHLCRLFEKFVLEYYKANHPEYKAQAAQIGWNIDISVSTTYILPIMQTDILLTIDERTLIIDTKYYSHSMQVQYDKPTIHSQNLYQIHTYVMNQDREHKGKVDGMLLYVKTDEEITPDGQMKTNDGNNIYFRTLDLNVPFEDIKKQLEEYIIQ